MIDIYIYRPDKANNRYINPDWLYTARGQNFRDWQRDKEEEYQYRVEKIKERLARPPKHRVREVW